MNSLLSFDTNHQYRNLIGTDEAGRGPLAGPVYAAAVMLDYSACKSLEGLNDSKKLTPKKRQSLSDAIKKNALDFAIASADHREIDELNIHHASLAAMKNSIENLNKNWDFVFIDGKFIIPGIDSSRQRAIVKGDTQSACIAAASILAKVARDERMHEYHREFPQYEFARHKGYPTALHIERLKEYGPSPIHRRTFCERILFGPKQKSLFSSV